MHLCASRSAWRNGLGPTKVAAFRYSRVYGRKDAFQSWPREPSKVRMGTTSEGAGCCCTFSCHSHSCLPARTIPQQRPAPTLSVRTMAAYSHDGCPCVAADLNEADVIRGSGDGHRPPLFLFRNVSHSQWTGNVPSSHQTSRPATRRALRRPASVNWCRKRAFCVHDCCSRTLNSDAADTASYTLSPSPRRVTVCPMRRRLTQVPMPWSLTACSGAGGRAVMTTNPLASSRELQWTTGPTGRRLPRYHVGLAGAVTGPLADRRRALCSRTPATDVTAPLTPRCASVHGRATAAAQCVCRWRPLKRCSEPHCCAKEARKNRSHAAGCMCAHLYRQLCCRRNLGAAGGKRDRDSSDDEIEPGLSRVARASPGKSIRASPGHLAPTMQGQNPQACQRRSGGKQPLVRASDSSLESEDPESEEDLLPRRRLVRIGTDSESSDWAAEYETGPACFARRHGADAFATNTEGRRGRAPRSTVQSVLAGLSASAESPRQTRAASRNGRHAADQPPCSPTHISASSQASLDDVPASVTREDRMRDNNIGAEQWGLRRCLRNRRRRTAGVLSPSPATPPEATATCSSQPIGTWIVHCGAAPSTSWSPSASFVPQHQGAPGSGAPSAGDGYTIAALAGEACPVCPWRPRGALGASVVCQHVAQAHPRLQIREERAADGRVKVHVWRGDATDAGSVADDGIGPREASGWLWVSRRRRAVDRHVLQSAFAATTYEGL